MAMRIMRPRILGRQAVGSSASGSALGGALSAIRRVHPGAEGSAAAKTSL